ncbi:hypothetical protein V6N13_139999 [Hibiscus sabdariffa]|uniref:4-coumarate--CoA ligase n=1 Tax=Hibiscus sabdariffa TaxID=183260 RepID=A0ABR2QBH0_9ROSI
MATSFILASKLLIALTGIHQKQESIPTSIPLYSISYSKLLPLVRSLASGLHHHLVVTTINPLSNMLEINKQMADCGVRFAFTQLDKVDKLQKLGVHAIGVPENMDLDSEKFGFLTFRKLIGGQFGNAPRPVIRQQDTATIMYSSGTASVSKGVVY